MALPFLKSESEETATQAMAFVGIVIITFGLTVMNVLGAIAGSESGNWLEFFVRMALAIILSGAELLAAVTLVRVMLAPNTLRKIVGSVLFIGLAWACIQNGKRAVHLIYPEFKESAALLQARADIEGEKATKAEAARAAAQASRPEELRRLRDRISALEVEQTQMAAQSPEGIRKAQAILIAKGLYFGKADGIRGRKTEAAMRARGEEIATELKPLRLQEASLAAGAVVVANAGAQAAPSVLRAELEDRARRAREATIWLELMLWVFEAARSFGLWALVTTITSGKTITLTKEELDRKIRDSARAMKAAETRKKNQEQEEPDALPIEAEGYWEDIIKRMVKAADSGWTPKGIADSVMKTTLADMSAQLSYQKRIGRLTQAQYDKIMRLPATTNGADTTDLPAAAE